MPFDIAVLDEDYKFIKELRLDEAIHGLLWRKIVNPEDYPNLAKAKQDKEDIVFVPDEVPVLIQEVEKLENYLAGDKLMSEEIRERCLKFAGRLKELCLVAQMQGRSVDFIPGD